MVGYRGWSSHGNCNVSLVPVASPEQSLVSFGVEAYFGGCFLSVQTELYAHSHGKPEVGPKCQKLDANALSALHAVSL